MREKSRERRHRRGKAFPEQDEDPLSVIVNLFDVAMVFAVALMVAMVLHLNMAEVFTDDDFTMVKNPGTEDMVIITKEGKTIKKYAPSEEPLSDSSKKGRRVGVAYELENGEVIYVPE